MAFKRVIIRRVGPLSWLLELSRRAMTNPYQSPDSVVLSSELRPERPLTIKVAIILFMAGIVLSVFGLYAFGSAVALTTELIISACVIYTIVFVGLALIYTGRNWARILFIAYLAIKSSFRVWFIITAMSSAAINIKIFTFFVVAIDVATLCFLLHKKSSSWCADINKYRAR